VYALFQTEQKNVTNEDQESYYILIMTYVSFIFC